MVGVILLAVGVWFGTANLRTDRAIEFDTQSRAALNGNDLGAAYQKERFAYALAPRRERALTLGSLAYLHRDYPAAQQHFRAAAGGDDDSTGGAQTRALVGLAAAAAQAGDDSAFDRAVKRIGRPSSEGLRLAVANAALDDGDLDRAAALLERDRPNNQTVGFAKALGQAGHDVATAQATLAAAGPGSAKPSFTDPAYQRFVEALIAVPKDGSRKLDAAVAPLSPASADVSRKVRLAELLYGFGDYHAAERLARGAVQSKPDYRDGWNVLAAAQLSQRDFGDAERSLKISTDLDASYGYTWYLRAQLADLTGKASQATQYRQRAALLGYEKR